MYFMRRIYTERWLDKYDVNSDFTIFKCCAIYQTKS